LISGVRRGKCTKSSSREFGVRTKHEIAAVGGDIVLWIEPLDVVVRADAVKDIKSIWRIRIAEEL